MRAINVCDLSLHPQDPAHAVLGVDMQLAFTRWPVVCVEGTGDPLQDSRLETPMDGGAWWAAVHGVAKSQTRLSDQTMDGLNNRHLFLIVLEIGKTKIKAPADPVSSDALF